MSVNPRLTDNQVKAISRLCASHRQRDRKRFGTDNESIQFTDWLDLWIEQRGLCAFTGKPMALPTVGDRVLKSASVDRIDNNKPHTVDNVVLVQKFINHGRNDASVQETITYLSELGMPLDINEKLQQAIDK